MQFHFGLHVDFGRVGSILICEIPLPYHKKNAYVLAIQMYKQIHIVFNPMKKNDLMTQ